LRDVRTRLEGDITVGFRVTPVDSARMVGMDRLRIMVATLVLVPWGSACSPPELPLAPEVPADDFELPTPDQSLDPARLRVGDIIASPCSFSTYGTRLVELENRHEWATVDVYFQSGSGPIESEVAELTELGVRVLYDFENVRVVRARVVLSELADIMLGTTMALVVRDVPDPSRYDVPGLLVGYDLFEPALSPSLTTEFQDLGGRVTNEMTNFLMISGVLPNPSIPLLRARRDVRFALPGGVLCADGV
jgi:hypothetical protein